MSTTITGLPNATTPLSGTERVPMDQAGATKDASTQDIANLAPGTDLTYTAATRTLASSTGGDVVLPEATTSAAGLQSAADKTRIDQLGADDSPTFAGLTITGSDAVVIPHIHGELAGPVYIHVKNTGATPLAKGTPVYVVGAVGDTSTLEVQAADASDPAKMPAIGLLGSSLAQNATGHAIVAGELLNAATGSYGVGDALFVAAGGGLTATRPTSGTIQQVAIVGRAQAETGSLTATIGSQQDPNWDLAYSQRLRWDGGATGLDAATGRTSLGLGSLATQSGTFSGTSSGTNTGDVSLGASVADVLDVTGQVIGADDPGADRILFWDDSESKLRHLALGTNLSISGTTLDATGGGTPAGTGSEVQFRDSGAFGAIPNSSVDSGTGAVTLARLILAANGAANVSALTLNGTWFTGGITTTNYPAFLLSPVGATLPSLNTAGTGVLINAPGGFAGDLLSVGISGTSYLRHSYAPASNSNTISLDTPAVVNINSNGGTIIQFRGANDNQQPFEIRPPGGVAIGALGSQTFFRSEGANIFSLRNVANAQTHRIYNTYTSATNFERAKIEWSSNTLRIGTEKGANGGTARDMELQTDGVTRITVKADGAILFAGLPTSNPAVAGQLWNDGGTLKISAG